MTRSSLATLLFNGLCRLADATFGYHANKGGLKNLFLLTDTELASLRERFPKMFYPSNGQAILPHVMRRYSKSYLESLVEEYHLLILWPLHTAESQLKLIIELREDELNREVG